MVLVGDPDYLNEVISMTPKALNRDHYLMFENVGALPLGDVDTSENSRN